MTPEPWRRARGERVAKHIGIVAGSAPGAALCYTTVCAKASEVKVRD